MGDPAYAIGADSKMMESEKDDSAFHTVLEAAKRHSVAEMGRYVLDPTAEACRKAIDDRLTFFYSGLDTMKFWRACEATVDALFG